MSVFKAIDDRDACESYIEGHRKVLIDYGVINITSYNSEWMENPDMYVIVAHDGNEYCGGIRVQVANKKYNLPIEDAISPMDKDIINYVDKFYSNGGVGELCGLWNSKKISGYGISVLLSRAGISIVNQLNFSTMVGICAEYTLKMFRNVGFVIDRSMGTNGEFPYPNESYKTMVLGILNASSLDTASKLDRLRMLSLRENPVQEYFEEGPKGLVRTNYNLVLQ